jgi:3,4-dehydroadipyl-CoA semialdehyde dehydrogenase
MATTAENPLATDAKMLQSYLGGKWQAGAERGAPLVNPCDGTVLAWASSQGLDLRAALDYSRNVGGPELRRLTYAQRAELLGKIADLLATRRDQWYEIARQNSGNTKADAAIDVDGSIGTLKYFAKLGAKLGDAHMLRAGSPMRLARDQNFQGLHVGVPLDGVAVHINAFNFPAWGLWEKAAVSLLAGVPVLSKPATSTAWLAQEMVHAVIDAGLLPPGSLSVLCGSANLLPMYLQLGDAVSFTGSAQTAREIRKGIREDVRVNVEADSLNAALLGVDAKPGSPSFDFFVREVVREMTSKAGQKCTAIRRVLVPSEVADAVTEAIVGVLSTIVVGDPAHSTVTMGPVVNMAQRKSIEEGIEALMQKAEVSYWPAESTLAGATAERGAFVPPTLFRSAASSWGDPVHHLEVFGPVATVVAYRDKAEAFALARHGGGSLAASVFSGDAGFLTEAAVALGTTHGRLLLVDPAIGDSHSGHGIVLPSLMHGGPGRAGGGEELGGLHGLWFYHQRVAMQASATTLSALAEQAADPSAD